VLLLVEINVEIILPQRASIKSDMIHSSYTTKEQKKKWVNHPDILSVTQDLKKPVVFTLRDCLLG